MKAMDYKSPFEMWYDKVPNYHRTHVFGSLAIKHIPKEKRTKLDVKGEVCIFVGYDKSGYRLHMPSTGRTTSSRHVKIIDEIFYSQTLENTSKSMELNIEIQEAEEDSNWIIPVTVKDYIKESSDNYNPPTPTSNSAEEIVPEVRGRYNLRPRVMFTKKTLDVPSTYEEAMTSPFAAEWKSAMDSEMDSLNSKGVYEITPKVPDMKVVKTKWVYAVKTDAYGNVIKFKARLTGKGYSQIKGLEFDETYAPVTDYATVRLFLSIVLNKGFYAEIIDITAAFLNSELEFTIFIQEPQGYVTDGKSVLRLFKSLYGLKQGAHDWYETIHKHLTQFGFFRIYSDHCLYQYSSEKGQAIITLWVDDFIIAGDSNEIIREIILYIFAKFPGKEMGSLENNQYLQWKIKRTDDSISISQEKLVRELLEKLKMLDCKKTSNPSDPHVILGLDHDGMKSDFEYRSCIGSLYHLSNCTRPDICYAVSYAARYQINPGNTEVTAVKRILQYLQSTKDSALVFRKVQNEKFLMEIYVDASYAPQGEKSTTGWIIYVNGYPISWKTLKQSITAKSSAESEYIALSQAISEGLYIRSVLIELGCEIDGSIQVYEDNMAAIKIADNPVYKSKVKQVNVHYHFIRDYVKMGIVEISHIESKDQIADMFTKAIGTTLFKNLRGKLSLRTSLSEGSVSIGSDARHPST